MKEKEVITLREFKEQLFSKKDGGGILGKKHISEQNFVKLLFPAAFLKEPLARQFADYDDHNNPTRNKIFKGSYQGELLQTRISELFIENSEALGEFVDHCSQNIALPTCDQTRLATFLLKITEQMPDANVDPKLYEYTKTACTQKPGQALAILFLFSMLHSNHTGSNGETGNIKFLLHTLFPGKPPAPKSSMMQGWSYINHCQPFLKKRFQGLLECPDPEFDGVVQKYSDLFSCVASISVAQDGSAPAPSDNWIDGLYNRMLSASSSHLLLVEGPAGTHKNALTQLLFLKLCRTCVSDPRETGFAPFYIDLNYFEKSGFEETALDLSQQTACLTASIAKQFEALLADFAAFCQQHPKRRPLLFVDSIRNYTQDIPLDKLFLRQCSRVLENACYVEDVDNILTDAAVKRRPTQKIPWAYKVTFRSVDLGDKEQTKQFLKCYAQLYPLPSSLRTKLKKFPFYTIDSYQLHLLSKTLDFCQQEYEGDIFQIYEQFCTEYLEYDTDQMEQASTEAFGFVYTEASISIHDYYTSPFWILLRKHSSFLDFFIARFYMKQLEESSKTGNVDALNMILPKTITRFVIPQINHNIAKEDMILRLVENHYQNMQPYAQSEMTYWLGRLKHPNQKTRAITLLRTLLDKQEQKIKTQATHPNCYSDAARKEDLFLLRGIMVSLIYQDCQDISDRYILSLIDSDLASQINRGFHLEYYGDIPYLPNQKSLNYEDNIYSGEKTLKQLFQFCENPQQAAHPAFQLCLFTICSLIQSRIEVLPLKTDFALEPYLTRLIRLLQCPRNRKHAPQKLAEYYSMILEDCQSVLTQSHNSGPMSVWLYQKFNELNHIPRTGWVDHKIPNPESITEHMYSTWLMAFLLLPETCEDPTSDSASYDKQAIMQLLLIHDLGEEMTGDIPHPQKRTDPAKYIQQEDCIMTQKLLLKGTYPMVGKMDREYRLWKEWVEDSSFNAAVAKDIDTLQAAYQLCRYLLDYRKNFSEEKIVSWLSECIELKTSVCRTIARQLIWENPVFELLSLNDLLPFPEL